MVGPRWTERQPNGCLSGTDVEPAEAIAAVDEAQEEALGAKRPSRGPTMRDMRPDENEGSARRSRAPTIRAPFWRILGSGVRASRSRKGQARYSSSGTRREMYFRRWCGWPRPMLLGRCSPRDGGELVTPMNGLALAVGPLGTHSYPPPAFGHTSIAITAFAPCFTCPIHNCRNASVSLGFAIYR